MSLGATVIFAVTLAAACAMPGASTAAVFTRALAHGRRGAAPMCLGLLMGDLIWLACAVFGAATLAQQFQPLFAAMKYAGAAYLAYLAWRFWSACATVPVLSAATHSSPRVLLTGLAIALGNPKTMLFYLALLPHIVGIDDVHALLPLAGTLALVVTCVVGVVLSAYVLLAVRLRHRLRSPVAFRRVQRGSAVLMAGAAVVIATR